MASAGLLGRVLVAVDGGEESMSSLLWALLNLKICCDGTIYILHVQSSPSIAAGLNPGVIPFGGEVDVPAFTAAIEAHQRRITDAIMKHALQICADTKVNIETKVVIGDPKDKICEVVAELQADLLVMGSRSHGPIKRMFLGSVSNYCTNHAPCPVMIVKN